MRLVLFLLSAAFLVISILVTIQSEHKADRESQDLRAKLSELTQETRDSAKVVKDLQSQLQPFVTLAQEQYPSTDLNESLKSLHEDLQKIHERTTKLEEAEVATRPRSLTQAEERELIRVLKANHEKPRIPVICTETFEPLAFGAQIVRILREAGWDTASLRALPPHPGQVSF